MNLKDGALLHNNTYRIERMLGQGGFGITYLAVHVRLKKKVAIKEFFPKAFCDREADTSHVRTASKANSVTVEKLKDKFIKEAEHIAKMDSPYIVRIIDVFEENHTAYYIMDYIDGRSLSDVVKTYGPLSVEQAVEYITKIGEALTYIHSKRMNHLDVKPANIMVRSKDNAPILIDFGLSKQYDSDGNQTSTTPVGISHGYAPIEQYHDGGVREFSPQTDLYSLAATLYYLISGKVPPQASVLVEDDLTFPSSFPQNLEEPIRKAMSSARKRRHEDIVTFIDDVNVAIGIKDISPKSQNNDLNQDLEDTQISSEKYQGENSVSTQDLNISEDIEFSDMYFDENEDEVPIYKKKWFIISSVVFAIIFVIGLYELGYIASWQPSYNSSDNSAIEVISDTNETALDSTTHELAPVKVATASNNENKNLNHQKVAETKGDANVGPQVKKRPSDTSESNPSVIVQEGTLANASSNEEIFEFVEEMPKFPGGETELLRHIATHINYPAIAAENNIQGRVVVKFVVKKDGQVGDVVVVRGKDPDLDKEAVRVVKTLPEFIPGTMNGHAVSVWYTLPINFQLQSN